MTLRLTARLSASLIPFEIAKDKGNNMKLTKLIYEAGIIGCGGAGFPTHAKYNGTIETIIINGAECGAASPNRPLSYEE